MNQGHWHQGTVLMVLEVVGQDGEVRAGPVPPNAETP